jgi:hypothetical protein
MFQQICGEYTVYSPQLKLFAAKYAVIRWVIHRISLVDGMGRQAEQLHDYKKLLERILIPYPLANALLVGAQPGAEYFWAKAVGGGQPGVGTGFYYYFGLGSGWHV